MLQLSVADTHEIEKVAWYDINNIEEMYASHIDWLNDLKKTTRISYPTTGKVVYTLDFRLESGILVMSMSTISMRRNRSISCLLFSISMGAQRAIICYTFL